MQRKWIILLIFTSCLLLVSCSQSDRTQEYANLSNQVAECLSKLDKLDHSIEALPVAHSSAVVICGVFWEEGDRVVMCNRSHVAVDLSGWTLTDYEGSYIFPEGASIEALSKYNLSFDVYNPTGAKQGLWFADDHDEIVLKDRDGNVVDQYRW
ncbi:lamin tail domain-containing protein [Candidatus Bipolaricaulota bacterium]|nr:lamin tail domain-containing protein [Candidatus Bipolaricaulota bacterium]